VGEGAVEILFASPSCLTFLERGGLSGLAGDLRGLPRDRVTTGALGLEVFWGQIELFGFGDGLTL
jgi:hypothetical protein